MSLLISDDQLVEKIQKLADELDQTPEAVIAEAVALLDANLDQDNPSQENGNDFWDDIIGMGASGDPSITERINEILSTEIDPIEGWSVKRGRANSD